MPAVSIAQQRFMGMVHAADKGETPASPEVAKVSADMKDTDAKDFASTKHDGLPDHVKEQLKSVVREVIREKNGMNEMSSNDVHFKHIMKMYDRGGSFTKKKIGAVVCKDPKASRKDVEEALFDADYRDIIEFEDELGLKEIREKYNSVNEEFKHVIHVDTPTQVVSKPIAAQIMALAKKGVRSNEIGLEMGFVGNQKMATDAFQKVKNQIYFALDKRNESVNEAHDCGCNENHDCGCGGVHEHTHIHENLSADANGIAGLTASRANAVEDFLEKNNINSNKLYLFLKKGNLKDRMDFVTALVGKPGNPIQKKVIKQFSN
jgi:predicted oxidoreductase (fatty acid repression mutant protein)